MWSEMSLTMGPSPRIPAYPPPILPSRLQSSCGVRGTWGSEGTALTLGLHPAAGEGGPMNGDVTLSPALDDSDAAQSYGFATGGSAVEVWGAFAGDGFGQVVPSGTAAAVGAVSVSTTVPAGANASVSLVFAWYFPDRDHVRRKRGCGMSCSSHVARLLSCHPPLPSHSTA